MTKIVRKPWVIALALLLVLLGGLVTACLLDPLDCRMAQGVTIGGLDVGGKNLFQTWKAVKNTADETIEKTVLKVQLPEESLTIDPEEAGIQVASLKAAWDAYQVGRKADAVEKELKLSQYLKYDKEAICGRLEAYASKYDTNLTQPEWKLRGQVPELSTDAFDPETVGQTVELTLGLPDRHLNVDEAFAQILSAYDGSLGGMQDLTLEVPADKLPEEPNLEEIYKTCYLSANDDSLDMATYELVPGSFGYHFDMEKAKEMVAQADFGDVVSIPMEAFPPEIYGEEVYFRDVLGDCETKHSADENRNVNLALVCQLLDGYVIQPGEEFSYNMAVGERTEERGFKPATVFSGNVKTKDFGGGVCQGSTTLYNCLLEADMEIVERHGHGALVSYVKLGLDAAVNWLTKTDLIFKNNSHFPVKIQAELSDGYMKMKLLGTDEKDYYIKMEATSYREDDYYYACSYKCKYDKQTDELISRDREVFSSYVAELPG